MSFSRLRKNLVHTHSTVGIFHNGADPKIAQDAQKGHGSHPPSPGVPRRAVPAVKAAASEEARRTLRYVEPLSDARTMLTDFPTLLQLKHEFDADSPQMDIGMVCPIDGGVKIPGNRPRLIEPFLKGHIQSNRFRPEHGRSSARY